MTVQCPICRNETYWEGNPWRPFCSERCQLIDLGAWASGQYRMPGPYSQAPAGPEEADENPSEPTKP